MIYFTSDTHFGHFNIIEVCKRPGPLGWMNKEEAVAAMDKYIIENWNLVVKPEDEVYHLGDFFWCGAARAEEIVKQLNGKKYWIRGNHDSKSHINRCSQYFEWVKDYHEQKFQLEYENEDGELVPYTQFVVMMHYPIYSWNAMAHGSWMLHGHCHGSLGDQQTLRYDVGVDPNHMKPLSIEQIGKILALKTVKPVDHHIPKDLKFIIQEGEVKRTT